jgi:hypothetical protein
MRRHRTFVAVSVAAALVAALATAAPGLSERSSVEAKAPPRVIKVVARIRESVGENHALLPVTITFRPAIANVGTVMFVVRNSASDGYQVEINGVRTKPLGSNGGTDVIRVKFKRPGKYSVGLGTSGGGDYYTGALFRVVR